MPLLKNLPLKKIRNLGGKLGEEVELKLQVNQAGEIWWVIYFHSFRSETEYSLILGVSVWDNLKRLLDNSGQNGCIIL
jgi:hypothetical protein